MKPRKNPSYRLHKPSGQAVVTLDGKDHYCGEFGTEASKAKYDAFIVRWIEAGRREIPKAITIGNLVARYAAHSEVYYTKQGATTSQFERIRLVTRAVAERHGDELPAAFGPQKFKALRKTWVGKGLCRNTVNAYAKAVIEMFRWGVEEGIVNGMTLFDLKAVKPIGSGREQTHDRPKVMPVSIDRVQAVIKKTNRRVGNMIRVQLITGMRSGDVCSMRWCDIDRSGDVWIYEPKWHKTQHLGVVRQVALSQDVRNILEEYAHLPPGVPIFRSSQSKTRDEEMSLKLLKVKVRNYYNSIKMACLRAWPHPTIKTSRHSWTQDEKVVMIEHIMKVRWFPHQLRHLSATLIRANLDIEAARVTLGHSTVATTERYAQPDMGAIHDRTAKAGQQISQLLRGD